MATYSPLATAIINLKTNAVSTRSSGGSTPTPPEPPEETWYDKVTGMINCSNELLECNGEIIPCL